MLNGPGTILQLPELLLLLLLASETSFACVCREHTLRLDSAVLLLLEFSQFGNQTENQWRNQLRDVHSSRRDPSWMSEAFRAKSAVKMQYNLQTCCSRYCSFKRIPNICSFACKLRNAARLSFYCRAIRIAIVNVDRKYYSRRRINQANCSRRKKGKIIANKARYRKPITIIDF